MKLSFIAFLGATALVAQQQSSVVDAAASVRLGGGEESIARGVEQKRRLKSGGSMKTPEELAMEYNEKLAKLEAKCEKLNTKITALETELTTALASEATAATEVTGAATAVPMAPTTTFPSDSVSAAVRADEADLFLAQCKVLKDEVEEYQDLVKATAKIEAKIEKYTEDLEELVEEDLAELVADDEFTNVANKNTAVECVVPPVVDCRRC